MSPRGNSAASSASSRTASSPYSRRPAGQPKSSRQQFSACGACRMRRVRCDLKDLPISSAGPHTTCSNCKERGLKCVDEFADVKAVKLLRRGRRLQQVEAIYGKVTDQDGASSSSPPATRLTNVIPHLQAEFFASPFWHWLCVQRPILDPIEFPARFFAHSKGTHNLGHEGGLLAMLLVVWASSFGIDERGAPEADDADPSDSSAALELTALPLPRRGSVQDGSSGKEGSPRAEIQRRRRKDRTETMIREVLELIDFHGVLRRPTWDGVRVLLLILPLLDEVHPLERLAMHEAALSQTQALCSLATPTLEPSSLQFANGSDGTLIRARIFWYAHLQEGISTGIRGGRLVLRYPEPQSSTYSTLPLNTIHSSLPYSQRASPSHSYLQLTQLFSTPLGLSAVCRKVHNVLTGPRATRRAAEHGLIDAHGMRDIWEDLDRYWDEFDGVQRSVHEQKNFDTERFIAAWKIFIFECHNNIRESLKQCISESPANDNSTRPGSYSSSSPYLPPHHLHQIATRKCHRLLPIVLDIIKVNLAGGGADAGGLFRWDAGIIRDGCFFAGFLAASSDGDMIDYEEGDNYHSDGAARFGTEEAVGLCLEALGEMRWAYSKSEERAETIRMVWENRKNRRQGHYTSRAIGHDSYRYSARLPDHQTQHVYGGKSIHHINPHHILGIPGLNERPHLPPLSLSRPSTHPGSAPNTACSIDSHGVSGWPSYTPPGTGTSVTTTSTGTGLSARGSPIFPNLTNPFKTDDSFYHVGNDLDQFTFNVPATSSIPNDTMANSYHRGSQPIHGASPSGYLDSGVFTSPVIIGQGDDLTGCPQFGEDCTGFSHH
ncbi:hypothetical protein BD779DRAFT_1501136 [Infundibulicybe gibba]|nr:hypothetical protein BD779DRAFT_1501136 [Infundibulicybe gibba]